jgi:protein ImuA
MSANAALEKLRQRIHTLEETQRRFARVIPVTEEVNRGLPHGGLPASCIHEVKGTSLANAIAFSAMLAARLAPAEGNVLYIAPDRSLHPLGLLPYGVNLNRVLHISTRRSQDIAWAVMEALRCPQVSTVLALLGGLDLTESRRLQLAAEASGVTAFLLGHAASAPIASPITRWKVSPFVGSRAQRFDEPMWTLDLLYCRGGRPGSWVVEWSGQTLHGISVQPEKSMPLPLAV